MSRRLSREDRALWDKIRESVRPLRPGRAAEPFVDDAPPPPPATARPAKASRVAKPAGGSPVPKAPPVPPPPPTPAAAIEPKLRRRLSRGAAEVDGRIDLHGMHQARAHAALAGFLQRAQLRGDRVVLVITGKGRGAGDGSAAAGEGRGVLRQAVPHWLSAPGLAPYVAGFEPAGRRHGGEGALYVRLRRRR